MKEEAMSDPDLVKHDPEITDPDLLAGEEADDEKGDLLADLDLDPEAFADDEEDDE